MNMVSTSTIYLGGLQYLVLYHNTIILSYHKAYARVLQSYSRSYGYKPYVKLITTGRWNLCKVVNLLLSFYIINLCVSVCVCVCVLSHMAYKDTVKN